MNLTERFYNGNLYCEYQDRTEFVAFIRRLPKHVDRMHEIAAANGHEPVWKGPPDEAFDPETCPGPEFVHRPVVPRPDAAQLDRIAQDIINGNDVDYFADAKWFESPDPSVQVNCTYRPRTSEINMSAYLGFPKYSHAPEMYEKNYIDRLLGLDSGAQVGFRATVYLEIPSDTSDPPLKRLLFYYSTASGLFPDIGDNENRGYLYNPDFPLDSYMAPLTLARKYIPPERCS